jgi:hypothetical protein
MTAVSLLLRLCFLMLLLLLNCSSCCIHSSPHKHHHAPVPYSCFQFTVKTAGAAAPASRLLLSPTNQQRGAHADALGQHHEAQPALKHEANVEPLERVHLQLPTSGSLLQA